MTTRELLDRLVEAGARAMTRYVEGSFSRAGLETQWRIHDSFEVGVIVNVFDSRDERDATLKAMNARAALLAILPLLEEPNEEMKSAARITVEAEFYGADAGRIWRAMLSQLRKELQRTERRESGK